MSGFRLTKRALRISVASVEKEQFFPRAAPLFLQTQLNGKIFGEPTHLRLPLER